RVGGVRDRLADGGITDAGDRDDLARFGGLDLLAIETVEGEDRGDLRGRLDLPVMVDPRDGLATADASALQPAEDDLALVVVERGHRHQELRRAFGIDVWRRDLADDRLEKRLERRSRVPVIGAGRADERVRV